MKIRRIAVAIISAFLLATPQFVYGTSLQAYEDYQYQFSQYRQKLTDYHVALTQYQQFHSLASQQDALDKARLLLPQRNAVAKTYALFLNERLNEDAGVEPSDAGNYRTLLANQVTFAEQNTAKVSEITSINDATNVSNLFVKNYNTLQQTYRQTIVGLQLGYLNYFAKKFDETAGQAQTLITQVRGTVTPEKQAVLDRWLLALTNQHSIFAQKAKTIQSAIAGINGDVQEQDRQFAKIQTTIADAKQDLLVGGSYLKEIETALQYE